MNTVLILLVVLNLLLVLLNFVVLGRLKKLQYLIKQPMAKKLADGKRVRPYKKDRVGGQNQNKNNHKKSNRSSNHSARRPAKLSGSNAAATQADVKKSEKQGEIKPLPQRKPQVEVGKNIEQKEANQQKEETVITHGRRNS